MVNCARIIVASTFCTVFCSTAITIVHLLHVGRTLTLFFILTAAVCNQRNSRTQSSGIFRFVQYSYKMEVVSFVLNSINLIVAPCIISSSCCSTCLQLGSTSSLIYFTLTLSVRYRKVSDLLLVCKIGKVCTTPNHYDHQCTDNNNIWGIGCMSTIYLETHFLISLTLTQLQYGFLNILIGNCNKTELHVKHPRGNHNCAKFENVFTQ